MSEQLLNASTRYDESVMCWATNFIVEFWVVNGVTAVKPCPSQNLNAKWSAHVEGYLKVNTDTTMNYDLNRIGFRIIMRDHTCQVMGYFIQRISARVSPQVAEAMADLRGVRFVFGSGLIPAIIESDAKSVMDLILDEVVPLTDVGTVISDILMLNKNHNISFSYAPRNANSIAHMLTRLSLSSEEDQFLLEYYLPYVENLVKVDSQM
ncbi:hypothetical protein Dsin_007262 [Dipteronia sinensis]|uniref:RNase H type-1 domain-containing protein n=1 Tax=Dipteronia sinensis TaxID=43782 RepID=A0AAE0B169_9ROSI|nr:hypothetical protein Dsin_007262 [Dipteronia sinensis]